MKCRKLLAILCTLVLVAALGATSASAASGEASNSNCAAAGSAKKFSERGPRAELTDEEKAERAARLQERLEQQLADGKITQEQYDEIIQAIKDGKMPMGRGGFGEKRAELTDEQKIEMGAKMKERLAQQLADGKITQEKYDEMIQAMNDGKMPMGFGRSDRRRADAN